MSERVSAAIDDSQVVAAASWGCAGRVRRRPRVGGCREVRPGVGKGAYVTYSEALDVQFSYDLINKDELEEARSYFKENGKLDRKLPEPAASFWSNYSGEE